jgi:hypothetical protein
MGAEVISLSWSCLYCSRIYGHIRRLVHYYEYIQTRQLSQDTHNFAFSTLPKQQKEKTTKPKKLWDCGQRSASIGRDTATG